MDLYATLELTHTADAAMIREAYRRLAKRYHPDVSVYVDAQERFIRITEAYEILIDPVKRKRYDLTHLSPHPRTAPPKQQPRYERDVRDYQQQARERAERFGRMKYERFDHEYFNSAFQYYAPKMLGCLGIGIGMLLLIGLLIALGASLELPGFIAVPLVILMIFGSIPTIAWLSTRFDQWHNRRQRERSTGERP